MEVCIMQQSTHTGSKTENTPAVDNDVNMIEYTNTSSDLLLLMMQGRGVCIKLGML